MSTLFLPASLEVLLVATLYLLAAALVTPVDIHGSPLREDGPLSTRHAYMDISAAATASEQYEH